MKPTEILDKAVRIATRNGWDDPYKEKDDDLQLKHHWIRRNDIIFNHDFAKALWGDHLRLDQAMPYIKRGATLRDLNQRKAWQYHLQMMVIADNPIKYLGENI